MTLDTRLWLEIALILFFDNLLSWLKSKDTDTISVVINTTINILFPTLGCMYVAWIKTHAYLYVYEESQHDFWDEILVSWSAINCSAIAFKSFSAWLAIGSFLLCLAISRALRRR